jgi:hypothetical protein
LNVQRKGEKIDIYSDKRDGGTYMIVRFYVLELFKLLGRNSHVFCHGQRRIQWMSGIRRPLRRLSSKKTQSTSRTNLLILYALFRNFYVLILEVFLTI